MECTHNHCKHSHWAAAEAKRQQPSGKDKIMREYKEWDENVLLGSAPTIQNVHKGDIIKAMENDGDVGKGTVPREYEVVEVYKRTVLTRDRKTGFRRCFSYGDLLTMKIERQDPKVESIKEKRTQEGYNQSTEA